MLAHFPEYVRIGRKLADLHLRYEKPVSAEELGVIVEMRKEDYTVVDKIRLLFLCSEMFLIHDTFMKKNFKLTKDTYAAQHKDELDTFNKAVRTLMKLNGSTAVNFSALDAEFSALQSGSAELRTQLETLQPDISALKNIRKYIDMVLNKQQLSAPGGKTPEKESVLKKLNDSKAALEQKKSQTQPKESEHTL